MKATYLSSMVPPVSAWHGKARQLGRYQHSIDTQRGDVAIKGKGSLRGPFVYSEVAIGHAVEWIMLIAPSPILSAPTPLAPASIPEDCL
jgi:hypothetical protein